MDEPGEFVQGGNLEDLEAAGFAGDPVGAGGDRQEYLSIWKKDRNFVIRSFFGRLRESLTGNTQTSVLSFLFVSNVTYRLLCLMGLVAMIVRGGDRRLLGIAAAGAHVIYVVLTSFFYFVGLAYANVSEVTLFIMFMGLFDSALHLAIRITPIIASVASFQAEPATAAVGADVT